MRKGSNQDLPSTDYSPSSNIPSLLIPHQKFAKRLQYRVCNNFFYCPAFHLWTPCIPCLFVGPILYLGPTFTTARRPDAICGGCAPVLRNVFPSEKSVSTYKNTRRTVPEKCTLNVSTCLKWRPSQPVRPTATHRVVDTSVLVPEILRPSSLQKKKKASSRCGFRENRAVKVILYWRA